MRYYKRGPQFDGLRYRRSVIARIGRQVMVVRIKNPTERWDSAAEVVGFGVTLELGMTGMPSGIGSTLGESF